MPPLKPALLALAALLAVASPAAARPAKPTVPPAEPTSYLSTETAQVLGRHQTVLGVGLGLANYNAEVLQLNRGLGNGGEVMGHVAFVQVPGPITTSFSTPQTAGVSAGAGYKHQLGTWGPFDSALHAYAGAFLAGRAAVPLLLTAPLTAGAFTLQPRVLLPDLIGGNPLNAASAGLTLGFQFPTSGFWRWIAEVTPAYSTIAGRPTYQFKFGYRVFFTPSFIWDAQFGNDEFGVGVHPGHPENGMLGTVVRGSF